MPGRNFDTDFNNPVVLLAELRTRMMHQEAIARDNTELLGKVSDDIMEIKLTLAKKDGQNEGGKDAVNWGGKVINGLILAVCSIITAWATVKATFASIPPTH